MYANAVRTPNRLTVMIPIVTAGPNNTWSIERFFKDTTGIALVTNIMVRKGMKLLSGKNGRFKPTAQLIFSRNMERLRNNEDPHEIIRDIQSQLRLM